MTKSEILTLKTLEEEIEDMAKAKEEEDVLDEEEKEEDDEEEEFAIGISEGSNLF